MTGRGVANAMGWLERARDLRQRCGAPLELEPRTCGFMVRRFYRFSLVLENLCYAGDSMLVTSRRLPPDFGAFRS